MYPDTEYCNVDWGTCVSMKNEPRSCVAYHMMRQKHKPWQCWALDDRPFTLSILEDSVSFRVLYNSDLTSPDVPYLSTRVTWYMDLLHYKKSSVTHSRLHTSTSTWISELFRWLIIKNFSNYTNLQPIHLFKS